MSAALSPMAVGDVKRPFTGGGGYTNGAPVGSGPGRPRGGSNPVPNGVSIPSLSAGTKGEETVTPRPKFTREQTDVVGQQPLAVR